MANAVKKVNYTDEQVAKAVAMYAELGNEGMDAIAEALGKSTRSVRAKLVREGKYVAPEKPVAKAKDEGPTKKELLATLETLAPFPVEGFANATKDALSFLIAEFTPQADA